MCCRHDSDAHNRGPLWSLGTQVVADLPEAVAPYDGPRRKSPFGYVTQRREERPHAPVQDRPTRLQRANKHQYFLGVGRSPRPTYFRPLVDALACVADLEAVAPGLCGAGHMERRWRFRLPSQQCREGSLISGRRAVIFSTDGVHSGDRGRGALTGSTAASPEATRESKDAKRQPRVRGLAPAEVDRANKRARATLQTCSAPCCRHRAATTTRLWMRFAGRSSFERAGTPISLYPT